MCRFQLSLLLSFKYAQKRPERMNDVERKKLIDQAIDYCFWVDS